LSETKKTSVKISGAEIIQSQSGMVKFQSFIDANKRKLMYNKVVQAK